MRTKQAFESMTIQSLKELIQAYNKHPEYMRVKNFHKLKKNDLIQVAMEQESKHDELLERRDKKQRRLMCFELGKLSSRSEMDMKKFKYMKLMMDTCLSTENIKKYLDGWESRSRMAEIKKLIASVESEVIPTSLMRKKLAYIRLVKDSDISVETLKRYLDGLGARLKMVQMNHMKVNKKKSLKKLQDDRITYFCDHFEIKGELKNLKNKVKYEKLKNNSMRVKELEEAIEKLERKDNNVIEELRGVEEMLTDLRKMMM